MAFRLKTLGAVVDLRYRDEKLTSIRYGIHTLALEDDHQGNRNAEVTFQEDSHFEENRNYHIRAGRGPGPAEFGIAVFITPEATEQQRDAAFDFDLSCSSRFGGCPEPCELMPAAWKEAVRRYENNETPTEGRRNPKYCKP
jgi:hypothetical protein